MRSFTHRATPRPIFAGALVSDPRYSPPVQRITLNDRAILEGVVEALPRDANVTSAESIRDQFEKPLHDPANCEVILRGLSFQENTMQPRTPQRTITGGSIPPRTFVELMPGEAHLANVLSRIVRRIASESGAREVRP
jgi:hypothetical protein